MLPPPDAIPRQGRTAALLLALVLFLLPWQEMGDQRTLPDLVQIVLLAAILLLPTAPRPLLSGGTGAGWLLAFVAWGALGILRPGYRFSAALEIWEQALAALCFLALAHSPLVELLRRRLAGVLVAGASLQAVWALALSDGERLSGSFVNRNFLAAYLNIALAVALAGCYARRGRDRLIAGAVALLLGSGVVLTGSRGGWIGLAAVLAASLLLGLITSGRRVSRRQIVATLAGALLLAGLGAALSFGVRRGEVDPYRYKRISIWKAALSATAQRPWSGLGPGQLKWMAPRHNFPLEGEPFRYSRRWKSAHSMPLQRLAEEGVIGLVLAAGFLIVVLRALRGRALSAGGGLARAALAALAGLLVQGAVDTPAEHPAVLLSMAALAGLALPPPDYGSGSSGSGTGGESPPLARRLGVPGLAVLVLAVWGLLVAPWMAHRAWLEFSRDTDGIPALASLERALEWTPYHRDYAYRLGRTAARASRSLNLEQMAFADNTLARAAQIDPHDDRADAERGKLMMRAAAEGVIPAPSALRAAGRRFEEAMRRDPLNPRLRLSAALAALRLGEHERARDLARSALELEPNFLDAHLMAADASAQMGDDDSAHQALERFRAARRALRDHVPRNRYEEDLVKYNDAVLRGLEERLE